MSKTSSLESSLPKAMEDYKARAAAIKDGYQAERRAILQNDRLSDSAKTSDLSLLSQATRNQLESLKADQESYVKGLRTQLEKELRGNQPSDANSVLLRRDAADRVRKITDEQEAMDVLQDAIANGDDSLANAIGIRARNAGMQDVAEVWKGTYTGTADAAEALAYVEEYTSGGAYNLSNQITYAAPAD